MSMLIPGKSRSLVGGLLLPLSLAVAATSWAAGESGGASQEPVREHFSPGVGVDFPRDVFFGDLHLHSNNSPDAFAMGDPGLSGADAFRFARGEEVVSSSGLPARLRRPLDFLAVTDHAEFLGLFKQFLLGNPLLLRSPLGQRWQKLEEDGDGSLYPSFPKSITDPDPERDAAPAAVSRTVWRDVVRTADDYNDPGRFTAFAGYEWTSMIGGNNLHRCVIFRSGGNPVAASLPFSAQQSLDPEDLWDALRSFEERTGKRVMAIPHNGNLSNGMMWDTETIGGEPFGRGYAEARRRWEPVVEVTQVKGDSETHPVLSPTDEFADFERWDEYNIMNTVATTPEMLPGSYARSALKTGLSLGRELGINPFQFGMIGSTDSHTSLATAAEDNFFGKFGNAEPGVRDPASRMAGMKIADWELGASGLTAIWARENTRAELFDALERREVYATTGSRIRLRLFAGWDFAPGTIAAPDFVRQGYDRGVPMGSALEDAPDGGPPVFLVSAQKDPDGANLDRIQIIKGWLDARGRQHETVYDVALSGGREVDPATDRAPLVGSTVDVGNATYRNTIGAATLSAQWTDPDFDPAESAFYYARVLEIPTPRWTVYDTKYFGTPLPEEAPTAVQDRAYSSPVWYQP